MAARTAKNANGETRFGTPKGPGVIYLRAGKASQGAVFAADAVDATGARTTVYLWPSTDGKWRTSTTYPTNTEAGTVVGSQT